MLMTELAQEHLRDRVATREVGDVHQQSDVDTEVHFEAQLLERRPTPCVAA